MAKGKFVLIQSFFMLLLSAVNILWPGFVLLTLWGWFAVPLLNLPRLSYVGAMGIALLIGFLTKQMPTVLPKTLIETDDYFNHVTKVAWIYSIFNPLFVLITGWILHLFL
jgi:hypothetical protein